MRPQAGRSQQLRPIDDADGEGLLFACEGDDPWWELPIPQPALATLAVAGGRLEVELSWPQSPDSRALLRQLDVLRAEIESLRAQLDTERETVARIHRSLTFRLASPLHALANRLRGRRLQRGGDRPRHHHRHLQLGEAAAAALASLSTQTFDRRRIALSFTDNGSSDDSYALLARWRDEHAAEFGAIHLSRGANEGFGAGQNRAAAAGSSPFIFILNPDVELPAECVAKAPRRRRRR